MFIRNHATFYAGVIRRISQAATVNRSAHFEANEVAIPVPWGHIAGRHWNANSSGMPFLCLHGWKDNAASFDKLIPLLLEKTDKYQFICIDLPGHGLSSHYPPGMLYQTVDFMVAIRRVLRHFEFSESGGIHLMGHSLGAILSFLFAANHPLLVDCVIAIDALVPVLFSRADTLTMMNVTTEGILHMESQEYVERASLNFDKSQLLQKMKSSHMLGLHGVACETLISRGAVEVPANSGKYKFSHDPRIHFLPLMGISPTQIRYQACAFRSKLLFIKAENGINYITDYMQANILKWLAEDNKNLIQFTTAKKAPHHVHLVEPEKIVSDILQFLSASH